MSKQIEEATLDKLSGYSLSRKWFDFCFENPEKIKPIHTAIYFFAVEHCNRLGWKPKFGFPSQMVMEAIGVKNWRTYSKALNELVEFGFIEMIEKSKNQYSSNIIAIVKNTKAQSKALDKALQKHCTKQGKSTVSIDKPLNKEPKNNILSFEEFWNIYDKKVGRKHVEPKFKKLTKKELEQIKETLPAYIKSRPDKKYRKNPLTYLNAKAWEDEIEDPKQKPKRSAEYFKLNNWTQ